MWTVFGPRDAIASQVVAWRPGTLVHLGGTTLGARSSSLLMAGTIRISRMVDGKPTPVTLRPEDFPALEAQLDAMLYLGAADPRVDPPPALYRDSAYVAELRRRARVLLPSSGDYPQDIDTLVKEAEASGRPTAPEGRSAPGR